MAAGFIVVIALTTNYFNETSVELRCEHNSNQRVAVGFYRKVPYSNAFERTIAIGGKTENCTVTPLPDNVKCYCISEQNMGCKIYQQRPTNDGEKWKCAIPSNSIAVFSNIVRLSFSDSC
ncbi:hypothetical protein DPMN_013366 [Dreissena polymorpha]|uniref:Uncharacterized protein n=1 Tax=Dreissena polymorpha TaxID=45954 RepID=A0A9D4N7J6_DREPO|nr:hypothetical protein DPMN_013366 [Dreissena polymorpha]